MITTPSGTELESERTWRLSSEETIRSPGELTPRREPTDEESFSGEAAPTAPAKRTGATPSCPGV